MTPRLTLAVASDVAGSIRLGVEASADLLTLDADRAHVEVLPRADVVVTASGRGAGDAAKLLHTADLDIGALRFGLSVRAGDPVPVLELLDVDLDGHHHDLVDLSSADAVVAAAGEIAGDILAAALDALGDAGEHFKALLGLVAPAGVDAIDGRQLLTDPIGAVAGWWRTLLQSHTDEAAAVLAHLRDLVADPTTVAMPILGEGTEEKPWKIQIARAVTLDAWMAGDHLVVAPSVSMRVDDLAGGCTVVETDVRVRLADLDLAGMHATFLSSVELTAALRARGASEARLALGAVAIVADSIGVRASWTVDDGFSVGLAAPNLAADTGTEVLPLVLPTIDAAGHLDVPADAWRSVETLLAVLAANAPNGWLSDLAALAGWRLGEHTGPRLALADLVADPSGALRGVAPRARDRQRCARIDRVGVRAFDHGHRRGAGGHLRGVRHAGRSVARRRSAAVPTVRRLSSASVRTGRS